jgi:hypothetical protein
MINTIMYDRLSGCSHAIGLGAGGADFRGFCSMKTFQDGAYAMAALSACVVAMRTLVQKGVASREEVVRAILDEAVQRAIFAEGRVHDTTVGHTTAEMNRQSAEILKMIAESL